MVNVRLVVPFSGMLAAPNDFAMVGGATTVIIAVLLVPLVPPLAPGTLRVVFLLPPRVPPVPFPVKVKFGGGPAPPAAKRDDVRADRVGPAARRCRSCVGRSQPCRQRIG